MPYEETNGFDSTQEILEVEPATSLYIYLYIPTAATMGQTPPSFAFLILWCPSVEVHFDVPEKSRLSGYKAVFQELACYDSNGTLMETYYQK